MSHDVRKVISNSINVPASGQDLFIVRIEPTQVNYNVTSQNGTVSINQILWNNVNLPSLSNSVIAKLFRVRYQVTVTCNALPPVYLPQIAGSTYQFTWGGYAGTGVLASMPTMCLADFPLSKCTDTLQVTINSQSNTINLRQCLGLLKRKFPNELLEKYATECPTLQDNATALPTEKLVATATGSATAGSPITVSGFNISCQPFSNYFNSACGNTRAGFYPISSTATSVTYEVVEPVLCGPCTLSDLDVPLANINTLSVQYNMSSLGEMFTMANGGLYPAGYAVTLAQNAYLELVISNVDSTLVSIPQQLTTEYENVQVYTNTVSTPLNFTTGAPATLSSAVSQTLRLQNMPDLIMVGCRVQESARAQYATAGNPSYADAFLQWGTFAGGQIAASAGNYITQANGQSVISIQLNNRTGLCSSMSVEELWRLSVKNGLNMNYQQFSYCGAPAIFRPEDLGLSLEQGDLPVGLSGNVNLTITGTWNTSNYIVNAQQLATGNWSAAGANTITTAEIVVVVIYKGVAYITPDSMNLSTSYLTAAEINQVLRANGEPYIPAKALMDKPEQGGGLFGTAKNILHSTATALQAAKNPSFQKVVEGVKELTGGRMKHKRGGAFSYA